MGKGIALEFKNRYSKNYAFYKTAFDTGELKTGSVLVFVETMVKPSSTFLQMYIGKNASKYGYIADGLKALSHKIEEHSLKSIAIPALGCGLGGLTWGMVKELIENEFRSINAEIYVYEPY